MFSQCPAEVLHVPTTRDEFIRIGHANKCGLHLVLLRSNLPNDESLGMIARVREAINGHPELSQSGLGIFVLFLDKLQANHSPTRDKKSKRTPVIAADNIGAACARRWVIGIQQLLVGTSKEHHSSIHFLEKVSA